jgi:hypothetical protein
MAISRNNHIYGIVRAYVDHVGPELRTELDRIGRSRSSAKGPPKIVLDCGKTHRPSRSD